MNHRLFSLRAVCAPVIVAVLAPGLFAASETTTPEQSRLALCRHNGSGAAIRISDDDTISCPLAEGETTFILALPRASTRDRLTFVNDNTAARGELSIAVSDEELPPQSTQWAQVEGAVAFHHKRRFDLSMVGIQARYVRVTFKVERESGGLNLALTTPDSAKGTLGDKTGLSLIRLDVRDIVLSRTTPLIAALDR